MKTAAEWYSEMPERDEYPPTFNLGNYTGWIEKIQTDALREAAKTTSRYLENNRLHPDIPNEQLNESAMVAAHSVLQQAALEIMSLVEKISPAGRS